MLPHVALEMFSVFAAYVLAVAQLGLLQWVFESEKGLQFHIQAELYYSVALNALLTAPN